MRITVITLYVLPRAPKAEDSCVIGRDEFTERVLRYCFYDVYYNMYVLRTLIVCVYIYIV